MEYACKNKRHVHIKRENTKTKTENVLIMDNISKNRKCIL